MLQPLQLSLRWILVPLGLAVMLGLLWQSPAVSQVPATLPVVEAATHKAFVEKLTEDVSFEMLPIPGGSFLMGSPASEKGRGADEGPQHPVQVKPFWMGKFEARWDEYDLFWSKRPGGPPPRPDMSKKPDPKSDALTSPTPPYDDPTFGYGREGHAALAITHHAAMEYCRWLSKKTGKQYRLPTEAEWEWACRAGTSTAYSFGDDPKQLGDYAWYEENSDEKAHKVGQKKPNPWGLYDMYGNVAEWCIDRYRKDFYATLPQDKLSLIPFNPPTEDRYPNVARGGSWIDPPEKCRSAAPVLRPRLAQARPATAAEHLVDDQRRLRRLPRGRGRGGGPAAQGHSLQGDVVEQLSEFAYIDWLRQRTARHPRVPAGPGDDCAVVATTPGVPWLVTTDMLLEGSHFVLAEVGSERVGRKAMAVNLSDIAAMGGRPVAAVVSVALPRSHTRSIAEAIYAGMRRLADEFDTAIAGGDTNTWTGGLVIAVTLFGEPGPQGPILRSGARPGDWLMVTGALGGSLAGKHLDFTPRVREALALQEHASLHAMIDISDGLAADVNHLCVESGCAATLLAEAIPISPAARQFNDGRAPLEHALGDGEDFELAFAVTAADGERLLRMQPVPAITLHHIGHFTAGSGLTLVENGRTTSLPPLGYDHPFG